MWVCLCRAVSCTRIRQAIDDGACSVKAIAESCGAGTDCSRCRRHIRVLLAEHRVTLRRTLEEPA